MRSSLSYFALLLLSPMSLALRAPPGRINRASSIVARYLDDKEPLWPGGPPEDWSELDAWLAEGAAGLHEEAARSSARPRLSVRTAGHHSHDHFFNHNLKMRDWSALGASRRLVSNLQRLGFDQPSTAQASAFGPISRGEDLLLAEATGMGKTLAYVAPLVQKIWEIEDAEGRTPPGEVRTIIIVPTSDLAQQVLELSREVGKRSIRASIATGNASWRTQRQRMAGGLDLLVATMGRLSAHTSPRDSSPSFDLSKTRLVVLDEASSLYQGSAPSWLAHKAARAQASENRASAATSRLPVRQGAPLAMWRQLNEGLSTACAKVMVTHALPGGVEEQMRADLGEPLAVRIGRGLHTTRSGIEIELVDCRADVEITPSVGQAALFEAKLEEVRDALAATAATHALIVCNAASTCDRIQRALTADPFECGPTTCPLPGTPPTVVTFHDSLTAERRKAALAAFRRTGGAEAAEAPARILVATGRAIRGLDLSAGPSRHVDHVVLFDYAPDAKSYLARVGFAARGTKSTARVTALTSSRAQLSFAKALLAHDAKGVSHDMYGGSGLVVDERTLKEA